MSSKTLPKTKYQDVRSKLEEAIRSGEFAPGQQFLPEQLVAERFDVSYFTARRAVSDLVEADLLERRTRKGTFVRDHGAAKLKLTTLNLITTAYEGSSQKEFISEGCAIAHDRKWRAQIIRLGPDQQDQAVKAVQGGDFSIVMVDEIPPLSALGNAMRKSKGHAISIGRSLAEYKVPSILVNREHMFSKAIEHLREAGHCDIAVIIQRPEVSIGANHVAIWKSLMASEFSEAELEKRLIAIHTPLFQCPSKDAYEAITQFLAEKPAPVTAILCVGDEITQGVLAACRDAGQPVPDSFSVINIGDSNSMAYSHPAVTCADFNRQAQFEIALGIFDEVRKGNALQNYLHLVEPRIVERRSVRSLNEK